MSATVFIADDDAALRLMLGATLRAAGFRVVDLADGGRLLVAVARSLRSSEAPWADVVVADVQMPVMTGFSLAQSLRDLSDRIPIVLMTAFPDPDLRRRVRALGVVLLEKPFGGEELCAAVRLALESPR